MDLSLPHRKIMRPNKIVLDDIDLRSPAHLNFCNLTAHATHVHSCGLRSKSLRSNERKLFTT